MENSLIQYPSFLYYSSLLMIDVSYTLDYSWYLHRKKSSVAWWIRLLSLPRRAWGSFSDMCEGSYTFAQTFESKANEIDLMGCSLLTDMQWEWGAPFSYFLHRIWHESCVFNRSIKQTRDVGDCHTDGIDIRILFEDVGFYSGARVQNTVRVRYRVIGGRTRRSSISCRNAKAAELYSRGRKIVQEIVRARTSSYVLQIQQARNPSRTTIDALY
jgi:hypothetical protein